MDQVNNKLKPQRDSQYYMNSIMFQVSIANLDIFEPSLDFVWVWVDLFKVPRWYFERNQFSVI